MRRDPHVLRRPYFTNPRHSRIPSIRNIPVNGHLVIETFEQVDLPPHIFAHGIERADGRGGVFRQIKNRACLAAGAPIVGGFVEFEDLLVGNTAGVDIPGHEILGRIARVGDMPKPIGAHREFCAGVFDAPFGGANDRAIQFVVTVIVGHHGTALDAAEIFCINSPLIFLQIPVMITLTLLPKLPRRFLKMKTIKASCFVDPELG